MPNPSDLQLLKHDPNQLLHKYQSLLDKAVTVLIEQRILHPNDKQQVIQLLHQKLLVTLQNRAISQPLFCSIPAYLASLTNEVLSNLVDVYLVTQNSPQLIVKYEKMIWKIVRAIGNQAQWEEATQQDLFQTINAKLLEKLQAGKLQQYQGDALFSTFLYVIVKRMAKNEVIKKQKQVEQQRNLTMQVNEELSHYQTQNNYVFDRVSEQHLLSFRGILQSMKQAERAKFEFCLKGIYRIILNNMDIQQLKNDFPYYSDDILLDIILAFNENCKTYSQSKIYGLLHYFLLQLAAINTQTKADNLRKWFEARRKNVWIVLFGAAILAAQKAQQLPSKQRMQLISKHIHQRKKWIDAYFEVLVYQHYGR